MATNSASINFLRFNDAMWEKWNATNIPVSLEILWQYMNACELLASGARLNQEQRAKWDIRAQKLNALLIEKMEIEQE